MDSLQLAADDLPDASAIESAFDKAAEWVHQNKGFTVDMLKDAPIRALIDETVGFLSKGIAKGVVETTPSPAMITSLKESVGVFSGFKTFHEMKEAAAMLTDKTGQIKPFNQFANEVQTINKNYNRHYLKAEYEFTVASSEMAARWEELSEDEDRYNLQYRTVGDEKVRKEHRELDGITLPASDPFWNSYYPPNGWRCRCTVVKVRKNKYVQSNSQEAIGKGNDATAGKHQEMFRFNPGKQRAAYPAYNSYTISKCSTCSKDGFKLARIPNNELCAACKVIKEMKGAQERARNQYESYDTKWRKDYFNETNGGYLVTEESRQEYGNRNKQEKAKYDKEHEMCLTYARAGYRVEHLGETPGVSSPDVTVNGTPADLKRTKGSGNIVKYARKAVHQQGAEMVLFQFDEINDAVRKELIALKREGIKVKFFITGEYEVHTL